MDMVFCFMWKKLNILRRKLYTFIFRESISTTGIYVRVTLYITAFYPICFYQIVLIKKDIFWEIEKCVDILNIFKSTVQRQEIRFIVNELNKEKKSFIIVQRDIDAVPSIEYLITINTQQNQ
jgi:hypothetical protein